MGNSRFVKAENRKKQVGEILEILKNSTLR